MFGVVPAKHATQVEHVEFAGKEGGGGVAGVVEGESFEAGTVAVFAEVGGEGLGVGAEDGEGVVAVHFVDES